MPCNYARSSPIIKTYLFNTLNLTALVSLTSEQLNELYDQLVWIASDEAAGGSEEEERRNKTNLIAWIQKTLPQLKAKNGERMQTKKLIDGSMKLRLLHPSASEVKGEPEDDDMDGSFAPRHQKQKATAAQVEIMPRPSRACKKTTGPFIDSDSDEEEDLISIASADSPLLHSIAPPPDPPDADFFADDEALFSDNDFEALYAPTTTSPNICFETTAAIVKPAVATSATSQPNVTFAGGPALSNSFAAISGACEAGNFEDALVLNAELTAMIYGMLLLQLGRQKE